MTLTEKLDWLEAEWRARGASEPLKILERAWPAVLAHTDQFAAVLDAVTEVKSQCGGDLKPDERSAVVSLIKELKGIVRQRMRG
jgi:hypothetical protein